MDGIERPKLGRPQRPGQGEHSVVDAQEVAPSEDGSSGGDGTTTGTGVVREGWPASGHGSSRLTNPCPYGARETAGSDAGLGTQPARVMGMAAPPPSGTTPSTWWTPSSPMSKFTADPAM